MMQENLTDLVYPSKMARIVPNMTANAEAEITRLLHGPIVSVYSVTT